MSAAVLTPAISDDFLARANAATAAALIRMAEIREHDCHRCEGPDGPIGRECTSRLDPDTQEIRAIGLQGAMCRWAPAQALRDHERDVTAARLRRLGESGCRDEQILALLPGLRAPPDPLHVPPEKRGGARALMAAAARFADDEDLRVLVLIGSTGVGKSMSAAWVVAQLGGCWLPAAEARAFERWRQREAGLLIAPVLVVDDLGTEGGDYARDSVRALLEARLDAPIKTLLTSNLMRAVIGKRYGDRVLSRLQPGPRIVAVDAPGTIDLRRGRANEAARLARETAE